MTSPHDQQPDDTSQANHEQEQVPDSPAPLEEEVVPDQLFGDQPAPEPILGQPAAEPILSQPAQTSVAVFDEAAAPAAAVPTRAPSLRDALADAIRTGDRAALADVLERGSRLLFATAVFLVPVVFDPRTIDAFNLTKLTALWAFGLLALGASWLSAHLGGRRLSLPRSRILRLAYVVLGITALATLFSPNRVLSIFGLYHRYEGLLSIALYVAAIALMFMLFRRRPEAVREVATAVAFAGAVAAGYVLLQKFGWDVTDWRQAGGTKPTFPIGTLGNSAFTASYVGMAAPFVIYRALSSQTLKRLAWGIVLIGILLALWFTGGRAGMLGAAAGIVAIPLFLSRLTAFAKTALVVLGILALSLVAVVFGDPTDTSRTTPLRTGTAGYRVQIWDASWRMFLNRPVLGWGPETFYGNYPRFRTPDEARRQGLAISDKPHNIYLGWATSTGIAGTVAYLALFGSALLLVARRVTKLDASRRLLAATFGAGLVAYLIQGVYSIDVPPLLFLGWVCVGGIAVLLDRKGDPSPPADEAEASLASEQTDAARADARPAGKRRLDVPALRRGWVLPAIVVGLALLLIALGFGPLRADHAAWAGERRAPLGWSSDTMELYEKAIALNPREAAYRGLAGSYLERVASNRAIPFTAATALRRSAAMYLQALELQPRNVYFMINAARVYARLGRSVDEKYFERGDRLMGQAVNLDPLNPQMRDLYTDLLNQWQRELSGRERRQVLERARAQAGIAQQLRAGRVIR
jgi:O-antigen ligase